jgi:CheY-like chemotaxis protein
VLSMLLQEPTQSLLIASPLVISNSSAFFPGSSSVQTEKTILLVDDDENSFLLLSRGLKVLDPTPVLRYVTDGLLATKYLQGDGAFADRSAYSFPDLVLLDLKMPIMDGFEFLAWVRCKMEFKTLPIAVVTDSLNPNDLARAYLLGATSFLIRPPCIKEFALVVNALLNRVA